MTMTMRLCGLVLLICLGYQGEYARAQTTQEANEQMTSELSTPALKYFGRGIRNPISRPPSRRPAPLPQRIQLQPGKPFQNVSRGPTVTPYLQLDTLESSVGVPNYYSRVLPQLQQQQVTQSQAAQLHRLQQQLRVASIGGAISKTRNGGVPTTGHSSQFLNVGGFFPTVQR